jgi:hypothetical protein
MGNEFDNFIRRMKEEDSDPSTWTQKDKLFTSLQTLSSVCATKA